MTLSFCNLLRIFLLVAIISAMLIRKKSCGRISSAEEYEAAEKNQQMLNYLENTASEYDGSNKSKKSFIAKHLFNYNFLFFEYVST